MLKRFVLRCVIAIVWLIASNSALQPRSFFRYYHNKYFTVREDGTAEGCGESGESFPEDVFSHDQRLHGAIALHFFCALYCFILLAYICNDYFLPSVECICVDLNMSQDVAGATFMAMATSTPELFINIIGTFITESDLGVGAVVGSSVFNTFGVASASGLATLEPIILDWWPLTRDCSIYIVVLITLSVSIWDSAVEWYESTVMVVLFLLYFVVMYFNNPMMRVAKKIATLCIGKGHDLEDSEAQETYNPDGTYRPHANSLHRSKLPSVVKKESIAAEQQLENLPPSTSPFRIPESVGGKIWWAFVWPIIFLLFISVPDCRRKTIRRWYPLTFIMCIVWLGIVSYLLSWMIAVIGETFDIPDSVMGLTLLAIGGCLPETISSIIMVRQGEGSIGISNSLGACTLDILMCLGLPWLVKSLISGEPVGIMSGAMQYITLGLLGLLILYYITMLLFKFTLTRVLGITYAILYLIFIVLVVLIEMNVFFEVNPTCEEETGET